jgi:carboxypeptidase family protein
VDTVGPGVYDVQIQAEGYAPCWSDEINTDEDDPTTISLAKGGAVTGRVVNEEGEAVTGAKVTPLSIGCGVMPETQAEFASDEGATETVGGAFALHHLPPGTETLKVTHLGYAFSIARDIVVREGETTGGVEIVLSEGATVAGHVYDAEGRPQAGETLFFQNARGYGDSNFDDVWRLASVVTDSNGFYQVAHLPEEVCYVKRSDTYRSLGVVRRAVVPQAGGVTRLDFGGTPVVWGVVVLQGLPQARTKLWLMPADAADVRLLTAYAMTDEDGAFALGGVAPGTYAVSYRGGGKRPRWLKLTTIEVGAGDVDLGIIPYDTSTLSLAIDGSRANGTSAIEHVYLTAPERASRVRIAESVAGGDGLWSVHDVEAGAYRVVLERGDGIRFRREITLQAGGQPWELAWDIPHGTAQITGRITGASEGILTLWREGKGVFGNLRPDSEGYFAVGDLPSGRYTIGFARGSLYGAPVLADFSLADGDLRTLDLDVTTSGSEMAFAVVQVLDGSGRSRRDGRIWLEGPSGRIEPVHFDAAGHRFMAAPGPQKLQVEVPGYRRIEKELILEASPPTIRWPLHVQVHLKRF